MSEQIESKTQFKDTPAGQQERWTVELKAAQDNQDTWIKQAENAVKRYLGEGGTLNLFHSNVDTVMAVVYGQVPSVDVSRRFNDTQDDTARVAAEMLQRVLQTDLEREDDGFQSALRYSLKDWKIAGLGQVWMRYEVETEEIPEKPAITQECGCGGDPECAMCEGTGIAELAPAVPAQTVKSLAKPGDPMGAKDEDVDCDYVHWRDLLWQPARSWHEADWVARRAEMTRDDLVERFGEEKAALVPLHSKEVKGSEEASDAIRDVWSRAEVWEIWCKSSRTVYWFSFGMNEILESKPDPLGLESFFPCPRPLAANTTTSKFIPKPDYEIAAHLYEEIDELARRIKHLEDCAKVRWIYDSQSDGIKRLFDDSQEGEGVPVKNWAVQGQGIDGAMAFAPIDPITKAIALLTDKLNDKIAMLYQVTGLSDIVRGQATAGATATEQSIKARFASTRLQTDQDEVARYASDIQKIRAEIIAKHFDPQTIIARSNIGATPDMQLAMQAAQLIKSDMLQFRVDVKADSISLRDYAALKAERVETVQTLGQWLAAAMPFVQAFPAFGEFALEVGQWLMAATKGSQTLEAVFDEFKARAAQAAAAPKPPDPQVMADQQKAQAEVLKAKAGVQEAQIGVARETIGLKRDLVQAATPPQPPPFPGRPMP